jgi:hypothetical protein
MKAVALLVVTILLASVSVAAAKPKTQAERCTDAFSTFEHGVAAGTTSAQVGKAFGDLAWLKASSEDKVEVLGGWIPVGLNDHDSTFVVRCTKDLVLYGRVSGRSARLLSEFLALPASSKETLIEFALVYPDGRIEVYGPKGHKSLHM